MRILAADEEVRLEKLRSFIALCSGLAFFLFGMQTMSGALTALSGSRMSRALAKVTDSPWGGVALGAGITVAMQSSSASTVMLVGLVDAGIIRLSQTFCVILGANIGTTLTAWVMSLSGLEADGSLLLLANFAPILAVVGVFLTMLSKEKRAVSVGKIFAGFCVLVTGMAQMTAAVRPLAEQPEFARLLLHFRNPVSGVLAGTAFTALIQSSSASVGILQALSAAGAVTWDMAIPVVMGQNIGTCVTAGLSCLGASAGARGVAVLHTLINLLGTAVLLPMYLLLCRMGWFSFHALAVDAAGIALCHTLFNLLSTVLLLPFGEKLIQWTRWMVKDVM